MQSNDFNTQQKRMYLKTNRPHHAASFAKKYFAKAAHDKPETQKYENSMLT